MRAPSHWKLVGLTLVTITVAGCGPGTLAVATAFALGADRDGHGGGGGSPPTTCGWEIEPPTVLRSGQSFQVIWTITGDRTTHSEVHWGTTPDPIVNGTGSSTEQTGTGPFLATLTAPAVMSETIYYYGAHAEFSGLPSAETAVIPVTILPDCGLDDAYEPNNFWLGQWYDLRSNEQTWLSTLAGPGIASDDDYYAIDVPMNSLLYVQVVFSHAVGDIDVSLVTSNGATVAVSNSTSDNEVINYVILLAPGIYFVRVYSYTSVCNVYDLWWEVG